MIFDLYEDVLSHSWHRFYYGVESEPEEFNAGCVSFASVKEVLEKLGWKSISYIYEGSSQTIRRVEC